MFHSLMKSRSSKCRPVNLNTIARQKKRKRQGKPSSKYRTISLDNFNLTNPPRKLSHSRHNNNNQNNNNQNNNNQNNNNQNNPIMECEFKTTNLKTNKTNTMTKKVRLNDIRKVDDKLKVKENFKIEYKCRSKDGKNRHSFSRMNVRKGSHSNSHRKPLRQKPVKKSSKLSTLYNKSMITEDDYNDANFNVNEIKPVIMINNDRNANARLFSKPKKRKSIKGKKETKPSTKKKPPIKKKASTKKKPKPKPTKSNEMKEKTSSKHTKQNKNSVKKKASIKKSINKLSIKELKYIASIALNKK